MIFRGEHSLGISHPLARYFSTTVQGAGSKRPQQTVIDFILVYQGDTEEQYRSRGRYLRCRY